MLFAAATAALAAAASLATATTAESWVSGAKSRDWMKTMQPWSSFIGMQEKRPVTVPAPAEWEVRVPRNIKHFLTNYVVVVCVITVSVILWNPSLLLWCAAFGGCWVASKRFLAEDLVIQLGTVRLGKRHVSLGLVAGLLLAFFITLGSTVFAFIGMSTTVVILHATFRTPGGDEKGEDTGSSVPSPSSSKTFMYTSPTEPPVV